jgi:hypothetical protein
MFWADAQNIGSHKCELCLADEVEKIVRASGWYLMKTVDEGHVFDFPGMLGHYVRTHGYLPLIEFVVAFDHWFPVRTSKI